MNDDLSNVLKRLIERSKAGDWSLATVADVVQLAYLVLQLLKAPVTYGGQEGDQEALTLAREAIIELTGDDCVLASTAASDVLAGSAILSILLKLVIGKLLAELAESGLSAEVVAWVKTWLEDLLS